jgi:AcrR family transcriptional regulator
MSQTSKRTRRTGTLRVGGRAARVVERVFRATAEELSRVGYAAMRVEDIAARSGVNRTTLYRRWPTKAELVAATMLDQNTQRTAIDTGTLRGDLRASLLAAFQLKPSEQGMLRIMQLERAIPGVEEVARRLGDEIHAMRLALVRRGIARGELPEGVDEELVVDLVSAPVQKALLLNETIEERYIERVLDVVLAGAAVHTSQARAAGRKPTRAPGGGSKRENTKRTAAGPRRSRA